MSNASAPTLPARASKAVLTNKTASDKFVKNLNDDLTNAANSDNDLQKQGKDPQSDYRNMFMQATVSAPAGDANNRTFNPKVISGGLDATGNNFNVIAENGASDGNQQFVITGSVNGDNQPSNVKVGLLNGK